MDKYRNRYLNFIVSTISVFLLSQSTYSIIVWDGKIVPAWPEEVKHLALAKSFASSTPSTPFGFFPRPRDTTYGVVMIVDFSDRPARFTNEQVNEWLNKKGYSSSYADGSVYDYFHQISKGKFNLLNDVFGYYRAKNPKSYYDNASGYDKAYELVNEMVTYFDPTVDFSKYDNDKNGTTESICIVYAGVGQAWGNGILLYKYDHGIRGNTSGTSRQLYVVEADGNNTMQQINGLTQEVRHRIFSLKVTTRNFHHQPNQHHSGD